MYDLMQLFFKLKFTTLTTICSAFVFSDTAKADFVSSTPLLWERPISHVYVCSDTEKMSAKDLENFYAEVPQVSAHFYDGWSEPHDEYTPYDGVVIVAIASQHYSSDLEACLEEIDLFHRGWIKGVIKQAKVIGTVPEFLANSPHGQYFYPLGASWAYRYDNRVVFASYMYQDIENFSYEDAVHGALQFKGFLKTNTEDNGGD